MKFPRSGRSSGTQFPTLVRHVIPHGDDGVPSSGGSCPRFTRTAGRQVARTGAVMGRRSFDVVDLPELFALWEAGRSHS